jgi:hypothetical protein
MTNQERYNDIIEASDNGFLKLTEWEQNFIDDIYLKRISKNIKLTWPQQKKLIQIWERIE